MRRNVISVLAATIAALALPARGDTWVVTLDAAASEAPVTGRLVLFFITETGRRWDRRAPMDGPFYSRPQPIASMEVRELAPGASVTFDATAVSFPEDLGALHGPARVQAVLDQDQTERAHDRGPGNIFSDPVSIELDREGDECVQVTLAHRVEPESPPADSRFLKWIEIPSERLSAFYGREVRHRAGVALPKGYLDPAQAERRWPAIYVIPGFGGTHRGASTYARMHRAYGSEEIAPQAVNIVLDPESPLGHHGFVDSPNHGPRGTALVRELIPALEARLRLAARPEARIVTGHSSGAWSALWLQLQWPDVFGACWASAPDPVDFRAFQRTNLYEDASVYVDASGTVTPSMREQTGPGREVVRMTVRDEARMEAAIDPDGRSGQQWDAWEAMFSPRDPVTGLPRPVFDPAAGRIDKETVEHWKQYDISRLVRTDWERYGPVMTGRVRLACGTLDSFYLERAVASLAAAVDERRGADDGPGYILLVEDATHGNLMTSIFQRWNEEMRAYLRAHGSGE